VSLPLSIALALGILTTSDWISANLFHNPELSLILKIFAISMPFVTLTRILIPTYTAFQKIEYTVLIRDFADNTVRILLIVLAIYWGYGIVGVVAANTLGFVIVFLMAVYMLERKLFPFLTSKIKSIRETKELLLYSTPLLFSGLFTIIITYTDTLMIGYFKTATEVGLYNVASPTARLLNIAPTAILSLFLVVITGIYSKKGEIKGVYKSVSRWIIYVNVPLLAVIIYMPEGVLSTLFGSQYATATMPLMILAIACFLDGMLMPAAYVLEMLKKTKTIMLYSALTAAVNVMLNVTLIPKYGITGAAAATGISILLLRTLIAIRASQLTRIDFTSAGFLKAVAAGGFGILIAHFTAPYLSLEQPLHRLAYITLAISLAYIASLLALKAFEKEDKELFKKIKDGRILQYTTE